MQYELTVTIKRQDPETLAADFAAVTEFLKQRRAQSTLSKESAVTVAEKILRDAP